eukprot:3225281-Amphidinium_carterae.1
MTPAVANGSIYLVGSMREQTQRHLLPHEVESSGYKHLGSGRPQIQTKTNTSCNNVAKINVLSTPTTIKRTNNGGSSCHTDMRLRTVYAGLKTGIARCHRQRTTLSPTKLNRNRGSDNGAN